MKVTAQEILGDTSDNAVDPKIMALSKHLEVPVDEISNDGREFNVGSGLYLVLTDDEADTEAQNDIRSLIDDMGVSAFNEDFVFSHLDEDRMEKFFRQVYSEWAYGYADDIENDASSSDAFENRLEEEMADRGVISIDEFVEQMVDDKINEGRGGYDHYASNFGEDDAKKLILDHNFVDKDALIEDAIRIDGRGHFISGYDGEEHEERVNGVTYFIYRTN